VALLLCGRAQDGLTPLRWAALYGHLEVVRLLLDRGADKDAKENVRPTRLGRGALRRSAARAASPSWLGPVQPCPRAVPPCTMHLARHCCGRAARVGASVGARGGASAALALCVSRHRCVACTHRRAPRCRLRRRSCRAAVASRASPRCAQNGRTPLMYAAEYGHLEIVRMLLDRGANKDAKENVRPTHLDRGALSRSAARAAALQAAGSRAAVPACCPAPRA
jgi:hypothetical protein